MIENEKTHSAKYQVLYNRLTNGTPFTTDTAQSMRKPRRALLKKEFIAEIFPSPSAIRI